MSTQLKTYLQQREVAELVRFSTQTLRKFVKEGRFPQPVRLGRKLLWHVATVEAFLRQTPAEGQGAGDAR
jgi:excisionase family DNA binding protein